LCRNFHNVCYSVGTLAALFGDGSLFDDSIIELCLFSEYETFARARVLIKKMAIRVAVNFVTKFATSALNINVLVCDDVKSPFPVVFCNRTSKMMKTDIIT